MLLSVSSSINYPNNNQNKFQASGPLLRIRLDLVILDRRQSRVFLVDAHHPIPHDKEGYRYISKSLNRETSDVSQFDAREQDTWGVAYSKIIPMFCQQTVSFRPTLLPTWSDWIFEVCRFQHKYRNQYWSIWHAYPSPVLKRKSLTPIDCG